MRARGNGKEGKDRDQLRAHPEGSNELELASTTGSAGSFWDESQVLAVIRHAGATGRSPEEFFNKKWKRALFPGK